MTVVIAQMTQVRKPTFTHDDVIKWAHFPRNWPFVRGIHRSPVDSPHRGPVTRGLMFSLICAWTNSGSNNRDAGDLRRHDAQYDFTVRKVITFLTHWPMGDVAVIRKVDFSNPFYRILTTIAWTLAVKLLSVNATEPHQWKVNIGSGNGLVSSGYNTKKGSVIGTIYIYIYIYIWRCGIWQKNYSSLVLLSCTRGAAAGAIE